MIFLDKPFKLDKKILFIIQGILVWRFCQEDFQVLLGYILLYNSGRLLLKVLCNVGLWHFLKLFIWPWNLMLVKALLASIVDWSKPFVRIKVSSLKVFFYLFPNLTCSGLVVKFIVIKDTTFPYIIEFSYSFTRWYCMNCIHNVLSGINLYEGI